jgi:hypothetical protein
MNTLEHKHTWEYDFKNGIDDVPYKIKFEISGDSPLDKIIEKFESYLIACGYVLPENTMLDIVEKE